jgi:hypothetical protein
VELARHEVILAEGLTVESYLDLGDRANFQESGMIRLFPDFAALLCPNTAHVWETTGAAPLVTAGEKLAAVRRLVDGAASLRQARGMTAACEIKVPHISLTK